MNPVVRTGFVLFILALADGVPADSPKVSLKVTLPDEDAKVFVGDKLAEGSGMTRTIQAAAPDEKGVVTVKIVWEPNNYTKITRKRTLSVKQGGEIAVDLGKEDPKNPDDILLRYVPTPQDVVEAMCKLAKVGPNDVVYDLGCGDGRFMITALKQFRASRGVGIDIDPELIKKSKDNAAQAQLKDNVEFRVGDVLKIPDMVVADASVVFLYMGDHINNRLKPILQKNLKPGSRIVSHRFLMDDWKPSRTLTVNSAAGYPCDIHLWEIGAAKK
jgi:uncharacterized protein (TIGR03000 family)